MRSKPPRYLAVASRGEEIVMFWERDTLQGLRSALRSYRRKEDTVAIVERDELAHDDARDVWLWMPKLIALDAVAKYGPSRFAVSAEYRARRYQSRKQLKAEKRKPPSQGSLLNQIAERAQARGLTRQQWLVQALATDIPLHPHAAQKTTEDD